MTRKLQIASFLLASVVMLGLSGCYHHHHHHHDHYAPDVDHPHSDYNH